ncbi:MAG: S41 family peptidase [Bacilli bacterium]|nr:S41 family peptidase [Bacilli bacterium]
MEKTTKKDTKMEKKEKPHKRRKKKSSSAFDLVEMSTLVITTMLISLFMGGAVTYSLMNKHGVVTEDANLKELIDNYRYITENYYHDVDQEELVDGAIKGMLSTLGDIHSSFIDEGISSNFDLSLQGSYEGLGIEVVNTNQDVYIYRVFPNTPADTAGLKVGDKIISVDGKKLEGKKTSEFSNYVKKKKLGTNMKVIYERNGKQSEVTMAKKFVVIPSVSSKVVEENDKKVGYLAISTFSATTTNQFKNQLKSLEEKHIDSLIIDLRGNSGGHLSVVSDMLSALMDKSHVIYQIQSKDGTKKYYSEGSTTKTYPIIVLQDESSASASELMASALQEQLKATVVGTKSYGKGTVQELIDLSDGNQYKVTTKKWLTSKGVWIDGTGVKPDIEVELIDRYHETGEEADDNQYQKALEEAAK